MAAMSVQSVLSKCPLTALQAHNHKSPKLIQQCNNASSRWGLNNITQPDIDSLFTAIVLPKITYGLSVYAASPPDLNTVDLVPRSRFGGSRTKNRGRGEGKGEEETRSGKIRLRGPEFGPRVNCACSKSDLFFMCAVQTLSSIPCCVLLLKTRFSKFKAKPQTFGCFEGCSAAGRHVLAVLPTGYGVLRWKSRIYHNCCCLAIIGPDGTPDFGFEEV